MTEDQPDKKRLAKATSGVIVASIALLAAAAVVLMAITGDDPANDVVAIGTEEVAPLSPTDLTRPSPANDVGSEPSDDDRPPDASDDVLAVDQPDDDASDAPSERSEGDDESDSGDNTDATKNDVQNSTDDVVTGNSETLAAGDSADPSNGNSAESTTSTTTTSSTTSSATTTNSSSTTSPAANPAGPVDNQAPTNQSAPGVNKRILYVDGQNGSDRNSGTKDQPFRRPIEATSIAEPGTTIYFRAGTYDTNTHGTFSMRRSGTPENWIRIAAHPGERVELINGGQTGSGFEVLGASYVEVADFVLRGRSDSIDGSGIFVKDGAHDVRIVGNNIQGFGGAGISVVKSSNVTIERNEVRDNAHRSRFQGSGITIFEPSGPTSTSSGYSFVIRGNYVVRNYNAVRSSEGRITDGNCVILDRFDSVGFGGKSLLENNVCLENGGRGLHLFRTSNAVIRNNTLVGNVWTPEIESGRGELTAGHGTNITFANNLVFNRSGVASFINNFNTNISFRNNHVQSGPPPGDSNKQLSGDTSKYFRSSDRGGPVDQFRPLSSAGLAGDSSSQASHDLAGLKRSGTGTVGALEP